MIVRFIVEDDIKSLNVSLEEASNALLYWLKNNRLTSNPDKCHTLISTKKHWNINIGDYTWGNSECEKVLGIKIEVNLNFNNHISDLCKRASTKISVLARPAPFMNFN